ncbi:MAG: hypothetical protein EOO38_15340 [Cytophagaceae bacterium]|nr:MAG: hypothetical protein EOO38_15340 [Cytophagaceae bacterium]
MSDEEHREYSAIYRQNAEFNLTSDDPREVRRIGDALAEMWRLMNWGAVTHYDFKRTFNALPTDIRETLLNELFSEKAGSFYANRRIMRFDDGHEFFKTLYRLANAQHTKYSDPMLDSLKRGLTWLATHLRLARNFLDNNVGLPRETKEIPYTIRLRGLPAEIRHARNPMYCHTHLLMHGDVAQAKVTA